VLPQPAREKRRELLDVVAGAQRGDLGLIGRALAGSQFRAAAGQRPEDTRFAEIVAGLTEASPEFRQWWAEYPVRYFRPATIGIDHPRAGRIALDMYQLRLVEHPRPAPGYAGARQPR